MAFLLTHCLIPAFLGLQVPAALPTERPASLLVSGQPNEGQTLLVEVVGLPATPFRIDVEFAGGEPATNDIRSLPSAGRRLATADPAGFRLLGTIPSDGTWSESFRAPAEGQLVRVRGVTPAGRGLVVFGARELTVLPAHRPRPGDLILTEIRGGRHGDATVRLTNRSGFDVDLAGWTLAGRLDTHELSGHGWLAARDALTLDARSFLPDGTVDELVLADAQERVIDRVAYDATRGWPSVASGMRLDPGSFDAVSNDSSAGWLSSSSGSGGVTHSPGFVEVPPCSSREDVPDLDFLDTNCDGIDGDVARAIFVATSGAPTHPGTMDLPLSSIQDALDLAEADPTRDHVYVGVGVYAEPFTLREGVSLFGGYAAAEGWSRTRTERTILVGTRLSPDGHIAVLGEDLSLPITVQSLTVLTYDLGPEVVDLSVYGLLLDGCASVTLSDVGVWTGRAAPGSDGQPGASGADGSAGGTGGILYGWIGSPGGTGGSGANAGGNGGVAGSYLRPNGYHGYPGGGALGGGNGLGGGWISGGTPAYTGASGADGGNGQRGSNVGSVVGARWRSNGNGGSGAGGQHGGGGGGGGGGSSNFFGETGNGGGGGGGGAYGGGGGGGGRAGGGNFALFLSASTVALKGCTLAAGDAGDGGDGAPGGNGGSGGARGLGGTAFGDLAAVPYGGNGGHGGHGGHGGDGAGGGGGNSYALLADGPSSVTLNASTLASSAAGAGGLGAGGAASGLPGQTALLNQL